MLDITSHDGFTVIPDRHSHQSSRIFFLTLLIDRQKSPNHALEKAGCEKICVEQASGSL